MLVYKINEENSLGKSHNEISEQLGKITFPVTIQFADVDDEVRMFFLTF